MDFLPTKDFNRTTFLYLTVLLLSNVMYAHPFKPAAFTANINAYRERLALVTSTLARPLERPFTSHCMRDSNSETQDVHITFSNIEDRFDRWRFLQDILEGDYPSPEIVNIVLYRVLDGALKYPRPSEGSDGNDFVEIKAEVKQKIEEILTEHSIDGQVKAVATMSNFDGDYEVAKKNMLEILEQLEKILPDQIEEEEDYKSLWDTIIELHGREAVKFNESQNPISLDWKIANIVTRVLLHYDFLTLGIVDAPL
mmetsp:Transcript_10711/g.25772  ORF Transcript_10711/g.25772 Transcript_10711/m.25772 type:complete len:254 (-) Transcript_10711:46-807(-)